jgi:hypothetical protein
MIPALISAAVTFAVLAISQWIIYRRERSRMLLEKAEQLYLLLLDLGDRNGQRFDPIVLAAYTQSDPTLANLTFVQLLAADILEKIKLLVDFYFPALAADLEKLFEANRECIGVLVQGPENRPPYSEIQKISHGFADKNDLVRRRIVSERKSLTKTLDGEIRGWWDRFSGQ